MVGDALKSSFARDLALMQQVGIRPVVVHGGGPLIGQHLKRLGIESKFVEGVRVTNRQTMGIVEKVLGDIINVEIVQLINQHGGRATGLTGKRGGFIHARRLELKQSHPKANAPEIIDFGHTGTVAGINPEPIQELEENGQIPVIAPIGIGADGESYNINADTVASQMAIALKAEKLMILTNQPGILDAQGELLTQLMPDTIETLINNGTISDGMVPKTRCVLEALKAGVHMAHIIDGRVPHAVVLEIFTREGIGTLVATDANA